MTTPAPKVIWPEIGVYTDGINMFVYRTSPGRTCEQPVYNETRGMITGPLTRECGQYAPFRAWILPSGVDAVDSHLCKDHLHQALQLYPFPLWQHPDTGE